MSDDLVKCRNTDNTIGDIKHLDHDSLLALATPTMVGVNENDPVGVRSDEDSMSCRKADNNVGDINNLDHDALLVLLTRVDNTDNSVGVRDVEGPMTLRLGAMQKYG